MDNDINLIPAIKLKKTNTIFDALQLIDNKSHMLVIVIDDNGKMCGVASSGDLRKAILEGHHVSAELSLVMNKEPVCLTLNEIKNAANIDHILEELKKRYGNIALLYAMIPVVSDDQKPLGVINLTSLSSYVSTPQLKSLSRTVLIVGGAGYIGSVLVRILLQAGWAVRVLDKLLYTSESLQGLENERFTLIEGDAGNIDDIVQAVEGVDAVVYLAELVGDPACSIAPQATLKTNYLSVTAMAHLCSHLNINRFIYTSSCSVYGASADPDSFLTEESSLAPVSLYARMKALVEESILSVCNLPNPLFAPTILRLATVFGHSYRPRFDLVVNIFAKNAIQSGELKVFGGDQWRPNVHAADVGEAILKVLEAPIDQVRAQTFNVGSDALNYKINDLADEVKKVFPDVRIVKDGQIVDQRNYRVNFSKIEKTLGFKAQKTIIDGLNEIKQAYERGEIIDFDAPQYSNVKMMQELKYA